jgi:hypothetical protein
MLAKMLLANPSRDRLAQTGHPCRASSSAAARMKTTTEDDDG